MRPGLAASAIAHAGVLVLTLVSFTGAKPFEPMTETVPVDVVSMTDLTRMTRGSKSAPKAEKPKQVAEKVDPTPTPVEDPKLKVSDKPPVEATAPPPPPPPPPPKVDTPQPAPPKAEQAPPKDVADVSLKQEQKQQEQPKEEAKSEPAAAPLPPRKPAPPKEQAKPVESREQPREVSTDEIKQLLDKRTPQRQAAAAPNPSTTGSLGSQTGTSAVLSASFQDMLKSKIYGQWRPPGIPFDQRVAVVITFQLRQDGTLAGTPKLLEIDPRGSPYGQVYAESAIRAIMLAAPYTFLPQAQYAAWKELEIAFNSDDGRRLTAGR